MNLWRIDIKTIITGLAVWFLFLSTNAGGAILTVDNNVSGGGQFTSLQDAHDAAQPGDTIHLLPSTTYYSGARIEKPITIIGVGFDLDRYMENQASDVSAKISGYIYFDPGSEGSVMTGIDVSTRVYINADSISLFRNRVAYIYIPDGISNVIISQNKIHSGGINIGQSCLITIANNHISAYDRGAISCSYTNDSRIVLTNNIISSGTAYYAVDLPPNSLMVNNIILQGREGNIGAGSTVQYNMCSEEQLPEGDSNLRNIDMSTVFIGPENGDYHLKPGSPAAGSGDNGFDMGIYGGPSPYVDGGTPAIPSIYEFNANAVAVPGQSINVEIKAKSNN